MDEFKKAFGDMDSSYTSVPYIVHEGEMARMERTVKRLWILCIIIFIMLVLTNGMWIWYESQYTDVLTTETYEADADDGGVAISNGGGEVSYYGEGKTDENSQDQGEEKRQDQQRRVQDLPKLRR